MGLLDRLIIGPTCPNCGSTNLDSYEIDGEPYNYGHDIPIIKIRYCKKCGEEIDREFTGKVAYEPSDNR